MTYFKYRTLPDLGYDELGTCRDDKNMTPSSCKPLYIEMVILTDPFNDSGDIQIIFVSSFESHCDIYLNNDLVDFHHHFYMRRIICRFGDRGRFPSSAYMGKKIYLTMHSVVCHHLRARCEGYARTWHVVPK